MDISTHPMGMAANFILFAWHTERFGSVLLATWVFKNPRILDRIDSWSIGWSKAGPPVMRETTMSQETLLQKTDKALALVSALQAERDKALADLEHAKDELNQAEVRLRLQAMKVRRLKMRQQG